MPVNYEEIIQETGLPFAISPLHDKDLDPTGEPKKAIIKFSVAVIILIFIRIV